MQALRASRSQVQGSWHEDSFGNTYQDGVNTDLSDRANFSTMTLVM
ncbi:MAG: hypothetical protein H7Z11_11210 [Verrucomicrobia bacterium]|nr:hypothetical protein [Leptolyngbya sp. ES-bin-22]